LITDTICCYNNSLVTLHVARHINTVNGCAAANDNNTWGVQLLMIKKTSVV